MVGVESKTLIDAKIILEDLNGDNGHGLSALYQEFFRFRPLEPFPPSLTKEYRERLRHCVDLWLDHRIVLGKLKAARTLRSGQGLLRDTSALAGGRYLIEETSLEQKQALEITEIVGRLADSYKVLPAIRDDSYTFAVAPKREVMFYPVIAQPHKPGPRPSSSVDPTLHSTREAYAAAVLNEFLQSGQAEHQKKSGSTKAKARKARSISKDSPTVDIAREEINAIAKNAAERIFVEFLASEWRQRIARCSDANCKVPYFSLGKWRTGKKATLCLDCRKGTRKVRNQERLEQNRTVAKRNLCNFAAKQFGIRILEDSAWYKDEHFKSEMEEALNTFILKGGGALNSLYPKGIQTKWFMSGRGRKNWRRIEDRVKRRSARAAL